MAFWTGTGNFGTSMCSDCRNEIKFSVTKPDPDICPYCGAQMENGYKTLLKTLQTNFKLAMNNVDEQTFLRHYSIHDKVKEKMYRNVFENFLKEHFEV